MCVDRKSTRRGRGVERGRGRRRRERETHSEREKESANDIAGTRSEEGETGGREGLDAGVDGKPTHKV